MPRSARPRANRSAVLCGPDPRRAAGGVGPSREAASAHAPGHLPSTTSRYPVRRAGAGPYRTRRGAVPSGRRACVADGLPSAPYNAADQRKRPLMPMGGRCDSVQHSYCCPARSESDATGAVACYEGTGRSPTVLLGANEPDSAQLEVRGALGVGRLERDKLSMPESERGRRRRQRTARRVGVRAVRTRTAARRCRPTERDHGAGPSLDHSVPLCASQHFDERARRIWRSTPADCRTASCRWATERSSRSGGRRWPHTARSNMNGSASIAVTGATVQLGGRVGRCLARRWRTPSERHCDGARGAHRARPRRGSVGVTRAPDSTIGSRAQRMARR